jgi:cytosine/uracil/thiamine/allantoin permease
VNHAQRWIAHLGNVAAPLTGVVLADYLVLKRQQIDVPALFDPAGRYRYLNGVDVTALVSIASGVGVYYSVPQDWLKVAWGVAVAATAYLALALSRTAVAPGRSSGNQSSRRCTAPRPARDPRDMRPQVRAIPAAAI